jgi:predicted 3-demethylubiquinone-9 3-methyltransferase (glyoxalase superfamily)
MGLNGGPIFKFSPSISFFVYCKTEKEVNEMYEKLSEGGKVMMPLDKYPFSERYAFISDKFGVSWQIMLGDSKQRIFPSLLFVDKDCGKAEEAVQFYTSIFKHSKINSMQHYGKGENGKEGTVMYSSFTLEGQEFSAMDGAGPHKFTFTPATSFIVNCDTQEEIDYYWDKLSAVPQAEQCGWLQDKFGVSWQIVPSILEKLMKGPKAKKVMKELLEMKKLDIEKLQQAHDE